MPRGAAARRAWPAYVTLPGAGRRVNRGTRNGNAVHGTRSAGHGVGATVESSNGLGAPEAVTRVRVAIIGAGFAGIAAAVQCARAGIDDVLVLEAGDDVGGTWRDNTYPGAACDIRVALYSLSFAPNADWSRRYPAQPEIQAYLRAVADRAGLHHVLRTGVTVTRARFDTRAACWTLTTAGGESIVADVVVLAIGGLRVPAYPQVPGRERFAGAQFHTARYDHDVDLAGTRVGVIGTGASAAQLVPALAGTPAALHVVQRTAPWVIPRGDAARPAWVRAAAARVPGWRELERLRVYLTNEARIVGFRDGNPIRRIYERRAHQHRHAQVPDPALRAALRPTTPMGCKRVVISDDYYPALTRDDVHLHPQAVERITPDGLILADGTQLELDVLIHATGFQIEQQLVPLTIEGRDGRRLGAADDERPRTHLGVSYPGFPNLFHLLGPNTALGHNSVVVMIEAQVEHVVAALRLLDRGEVRAVEPRAEVADAYLAEVDARHAGSVWAGCRSWYVDDRGHNIALWPGSSLTYRRRIRRFDPADHHLHA
jgi:cation diffusion facilitator CzcD-associated flavoprotein CzcO